MRSAVLRSIVCLTVVCAGMSLRASAEITAVVGSSSARVIEFAGDAAIQTDFSQAVVPTTTPEPPAVSRAQLDRLRSDGSTSASGQVLAVFEQSNFLGIGNPNDVGLDLGAFSDDTNSTWYVEGQANETRTIVLGAGSGGDIGTQILTNAISTSRARSRVLISGVLIIASDDNTADLTGTESNLSLSIRKRQDGEVSQDLLQGRVVLTGGPAGAISISEQSGAFAGVMLPVLDLGASVIPEVPVVRVVVFAGVELLYEYDYTPGVPFNLDLIVSSQVRAIPGGTGASAVFGLPQASLELAMSRVKRDDTGSEIASAVSERVDTTGAAYTSPLGFLLMPSAVCGAAGLELPIASLCIGGAVYSRRRRCRNLLSITP